MVNSIFCHLYDTEVPLLSVAKPSMAPTETAQGFGTGPSFTAEDASDDLHNVVKLMYASKIVSLLDI